VISREPREGWRVATTLAGSPPEENAMSQKRLRIIIGCALASIQWLNPPLASAVGGGIPFVFREGLVNGAAAHPVPADSMDFTYHGCAHFIDADTFRERGYFWISSFQDVDSVVDSQINYFDVPGYRIYAKYSYRADQWGMAQPTPSGSRLNYLIGQASLALYLDPMQNTTLSLQGCNPMVAGEDDDVFLGSCNVIGPSEKSETDGLANGDFEIEFTNWAFSAAGGALFTDAAGNPLNVSGLIFNGNLTVLGGALGLDHNPEGSGNLYWEY
jgi:hypothetical protein